MLHLTLLLLPALPLNANDSEGSGPGPLPSLAAQSSPTAPAAQDALEPETSAPLALETEAGRSDVRGPYAKAFGGISLLGDEDIDFDDGAGGLSSGEGEFDVGFLAGAALGYRFNDRWALELEYAYRTNDVDSFDAGGAELADGGDYASATLMVNGYYHFDTDWRFNPYVGLGFGYTEEIDIDLEGPGFSGEQSFSGSSPSAQWIVGAQTELNEALDFHIEGRWFRAFNPDMDEEGGPGNVESEYAQLSLVAGISYSF